MTTLLMAIYATVMVSGIYGLYLQHKMPTLMKERLPAEFVFEQIPNIQRQLCRAAEKMLRSLKQEVPPEITLSNVPTAVVPEVTTDLDSAEVLSTFIANVFCLISRRDAVIDFASVTRAKPAKFSGIWKRA